MAEMKTKASKASVQDFLGGIDDAEQRKDSQALAKLMREITGAAPKMWGPSIVAFGSCVYRYPNGREMDWFPVGFSPRKSALTLYLMGGLEPHAALLKKLGKHKTGKGCLYINRLGDVDVAVLEKVIRGTLKEAKAATS